MATDLRDAMATMALCATLLGAHAQQAPASAPPPDPKFGDKWVYRKVDAYTDLEQGRYSLTFLRRDVQTMTFRRVELRNGGAGFFRLTHELGLCLQNTIGESGCGSVYQFPLTVGKKTGYKHLPIPGLAGYTTQDCVVEAYEPVKVSAGTFDAFRLECEGHYRFQDSDFSWEGLIRETHWYAPSLNAQIKVFMRSYTQKGKPDRREIDELVSYTPSDGNDDPTGARAEAAARAPKPLPAEFVVDGTRFAGRFTATPGGKYSGSGRVVWANGDAYEGTLVDGRREGAGLFTWANGQRYEGPWRDDRPEGRGKLSFANGNVFDGDIHAGVPDGQGKMTYASGDVYDGALKGGLPHGEGTLASKSGDRYVGQWKAGRKDGPGVLTWASGDRWEGTFADDERAEGQLIRKSP